MATVLRGRAREIGALQSLVEAVDDRGSAIVVRGAAGIGKSAVLAGMSERARAREMMVLATSGVQTEVHLPFAGLHQLLLPLLGKLATLPGPQRAALELRSE